MKGLLLKDYYIAVSYTHLDVYKRQVEEQEQSVHSNVLHLEHLLIRQHVQTVMEQEKLLKKNVHIVMGMDRSIKI